MFRQGDFEVADCSCGGTEQRQGDKRRLHNAATMIHSGPLSTADTTPPPEPLSVVQQNERPPPLQRRGLGFRIVGHRGGEPDPGARLSGTTRWCAVP